jgi:hypothetical protein
MEDLMYTEIEKHAAAFENLQKLLADPKGAASITAICKGLEATAQVIGGIQADSEANRNSLAKLYRGFIAASRIVKHLQDQQTKIL